MKRLTRTYGRRIDGGVFATMPQVVHLTSVLEATHTGKLERSASIAGDTQGAWERDVQDK